MNFKVVLNKLEKYFAYTVLFIGIVALIMLFIDRANLNIKKMPKAEKGVLNLTDWNFEKNQKIMLSGDWEFYYGELLTYEDFHNKETKPHMSGYIKVPGKWNGYFVNGKNIDGMGCGTYRLKVKLNDDSEDLMKGIDIYYKTLSYKLMIDNQVICTNGIVGKDKASSSPEMKKRVIGFKPPEKEFEIILQVSNFNFSSGGIRYPIYMGDYENIAHDDRNSSLKDMFIFSCLAIMGLYHIALYIFLPKKKYTLYFGLICIIGAIRTIFIGEALLIQNFLPMSYELYQTVNYGATCAEILAAVRFFYKIYPEEFSKKILAIINAYYILFILFLIIFPYEIIVKTADINNIILIINGLYFLKVLVKTALNKREGSYMILGGMGILFITVLNDVCYASSRSSMGAYGLSSLGIMAFIFIVAIMLSKIFSGAFLKVENLSEKLISLDKLKDEFLANTSHELRTPLNGIIGISDSLTSGIAGELSPVLKRNIDIISSSAKRLSSLVDDILDYSKLKHKDIELNIKEINLSNIVDGILTVFNTSMLHKQKELSLQNKIPENSSKVYADEDRLQQILYNLIGNAIKFTDKGTISVNAMEKGDFLEIYVSDTGIGISEDKLQDIFKSFEQVDSSISREYGGTGLGLSITKRLINLQGGDIYCQSELGKGSTFIFTIPLCKEENAINSNYKNFKKNKVFKSTEENTIDFNFGLQSGRNNLKILVVDDETINLQVMINLLYLYGYSVTTASTGMDALKIIKSEKFDLVILDVMMPKMSGYEVCTIIRKRFSLVELPIIMLTARSQLSNKCMGFQCGANDYVIKPFEKEELLARIETLITMKNAVKLSIMDGLTGVFNRRHFFELAEEILEKYKSDKNTFSVIMLDIDHFKRINDNYGHTTGDKVLIEVAQECKEILGQEYIFGRYGGEEFAAILPDTNLCTAVKLAETIRKRIWEHSVKVDGLREIKVTLSLGATEIKHESEKLQDILKKADSALYAAKRKGRNCTETC
ncbi:diguanylate cyclase [Clostridium thailandense]|uniref:diguanylate cyclase n=1 Tax=Clostridium thailandense TaxID=2794346 RepID=UPI00398A3192